MIEWEETSAGIRAVDGSKTEVAVTASDWSGGGAEREIPHPVDAVVAGTATQLRLPPAYARLTSLDREESVELGSHPSRRALGPGEYLLNVDANIKTYVRFSGPATVRKSPDFEELAVAFDARRTVTVGFRSRLTTPDATVTVPSTPAGLATALTHTAAAHRTDGPERSYPTLRRHPPMVAFGDGVDVPARVREETPETGIEVRLPRSFEAAFVAAPLAYYLGAEVTVGDAEPGVYAPTADVARPLDEPLTESVPAVLARTFWLDCLVRNVGPHGTDLAEMALVDRLDLDADRAYHDSPAGRLARYLDAPFEAVADEFPEWHLATYVEPTPARATVLPYLLDRLSLVYPPETTPLEGKELMERSLDDFYRGPGPGPAPTIDAVKPRLRRGRVAGWLAEGTPIDVFKALPDAYENRFEYLDRGSDSFEVTVVLNEPTMAGEQSEAADIYRERAEDLPLDVTLRHELTRDELADVFAADNDFVHYIGHCETDGLRCADGTIAVADVPESNTQTFFLNACGSYYEGLDLVRKGSVAGAVTFRKVLDRQAAKVGTAFARLLVNGFSIERALRLARRRIVMGKDYAVVGDGTHVLTQSKNYIPSTGQVERLDDDRFRLTGEASFSHTTGGYYQLFVPGGGHSRLMGNESERVLRRPELVSFLDRAQMPVVHDGEFYWSGELAEALS